MIKRMWLEKPLYVFMFIILIVCVTEFIVMMIFLFIPIHDHPRWVEALVDALFLSLLCAPSIWYLIIEPLSQIFRSRNEALHEVLGEAQRLTSILEATPDLVAQFSSEGATVYLNPAGQRMMGYKNLEEACDQSLESYHPTEVAQYIRDVAFPVAAEKGSWQGEAVFLSRDGRGFTSSAVIVSHYNVKGGLEGFSVIGRDITKQKKDQEELQLDSMVFEMAKEAVMITDASNNIIDVNRAFVETTGFERDEVLGKQPSILSSGSQSENFYKAMWHALKTKGHWQGEVINRRKSGDVYTEWISIVVVLDSHGAVKNHIAVFSDITETPVRGLTS